MKKPQIDKDAYVMPGAVVVGDVILKKEASVWYNTVIRADMATISVGERSNIQDGTVMHADPAQGIEIGNDVLIGHACILHGCTVMDGALVGMGSTVMDGAVIGKGSMVGAGSLVTSGTNIPDGMLAFGRPAKVVRPLSAEEMAETVHHAADYAENARNHLNMGKG